MCVISLLYYPPYYSYTASTIFVDDVEINMRTLCINTITQSKKYNITLCSCVCVCNKSPAYAIYLLHARRALGDLGRSCTNNGNYRDARAPPALIRPPAIYNAWPQIYVKYDADDSHKKTPLTRHSLSAPNIKVSTKYAHMMSAAPIESENL